MRRHLALLSLGLMITAFAVLVGVSTASAVSHNEATPSASAPPSEIGVTIGGSTPSTGSTGSAHANPATANPETAAPAAPAPDLLVDTSNRLTLNSGIFHPGDTLTATGHGFAAAESVRFVIFPGALVAGVAVADASGTVAVTTVIATKAEAGGYTIEATAPSRVASKNFVIASITTPGTPTLPPALIPLIGVCGLAVVGASAGLIGFGGFNGIASRFLTGGRL